MRRLLKRSVRSVVRLIVLGVGGAVGAVAIGLCVVLAAPQIRSMANGVTFKPPKIPKVAALDERSVVYDGNGVELAVLRSEQNRKLVPLAQVPKDVIRAILDVEDADFYRHKGVNIRGTGRALLTNVQDGGVSQGGSTITQQVVKLTFLNRARDLNRKIREARLAWQLEKEWKKDKILEFYLNSVYFGGGAYGVEAASERYFNKPVASIDVSEAAFLAGMIRNPIGYDPIRFRDRSRKRRTVVLQRLVVTGLISATDADRYNLLPLPKPADRLAKPNTYFVEEVKRQLLDDPRLGATQTQRYNSVFNGGLRIYTTFDPRAQQLAG